MCLLSPFLSWPLRRWVVALLTGGATFLVMGIITAVVPSPFFGRAIAPTPWSMEVLVATSILAGLLTATYVSLVGTSRAPTGASDRPARGGVVGGALTFFAIGCPVCNKLALLALGATGAVRIFAPVQPYLAAAGMLLLGWALFVRLRGEMACAYVTPQVPESERMPGTAERSESGEGGTEHLDPLAVDEVTRPAGQ